MRTENIANVIHSLMLSEFGFELPVGEVNFLLCLTHRRFEQIHYCALDYFCRRTVHVL
jgi:hypothetical protein